MNTFKPCVVIPVYNHAEPVKAVVNSILKLNLPCLLINDASDAECTTVLRQLAEKAGIWLKELPVNQGKGGAVMAGLSYAQTLGYTHALQVDADGQHNLSDITRFIQTAEQYPEQLICGYPEYDASVPKGRLYARYLTHIWVWINTLSLSIKDSMCGFRIYPLAPAVALIERVNLGKRMDFDIEILVRLNWQNQPMHWLHTKVHYPEDGVSHFQGWLDNKLISQMHAKLFFGMLIRSPRLILRWFRHAR